ncbi:hypothetical protein FGB62_107g19 [Gracilaria domingensis]|nr:hypothetical protein FGB62_107g19 [Gracilaria domingensis]
MPLYHIVAPSMNSTEILKKTSFATWDSGLPLERSGLQLIDRNPELLDAELVPEMLDICASNGYIHVVDRVLFSGILNQTAKHSIRHDQEEPCLDHSEEPTYSPEEGELEQANGLSEPTTTAEAYGEVEATPGVKQSSISTLLRSIVVGPVDFTRTIIHRTSPSSNHPSTSFEVPEDDFQTETTRAELLASPELTPLLSPGSNGEELVDSTSVLHETIAYNLESSPLVDDILYPSFSPRISFAFRTPVSFEEYIPSPEAQESFVGPSVLPAPPTSFPSSTFVFSTPVSFEEYEQGPEALESPVEPSVLPAPPITFPSSSEPSETFESEATNIGLLDDELSPDYTVAPSPQETFAFNVGSVLHSPESSITGEPESLEDSATLEVSKEPNFEAGETNFPEVTGIPDIDGCFPRTATVHLSNGNDIEMHELQAGHAVMACESKSSTVYMFSHRQAIGVHTFVRIESIDNHTIELSPEHYIYANGRLVIAQNVKVGDMLRTLDGRSRVSRISKVNRTGLYAPHTMHGDIVVGRIVASTYTNALPYWIAHPILEVIRLPVRFGLAKEPIGSLLYNGIPKSRDIRKWFL